MLALRCFMWLTSSFHEMGSGAGIKKLASRKTNNFVRVGIPEDSYLLLHPHKIARNLYVLSVIWILTAVWPCANLIVCPTGLLRPDASAHMRAPEPERHPGARPGQVGSPACQGHRQPTSGPAAVKELPQDIVSSMGQTSPAIILTKSLCASFVSFVIFVVKFVRRRFADSGQ